MPERPAAMDNQGVLGAEAAADYFFQLDHYAQSTGDTDELELMSHPTCEPCAARVEQARRVSTEGYSFEGGEITTRVIVAYKQDPATGLWPLDLEVSESSAVVTGPDGSIVFSADAATSTKRVEIAFRDGHWLMFAVGPVPEK
jgi:hypothetical protein